MCAMADALILSIGCGTYGREHQIASRENVKGIMSPNKETNGPPGTTFPTPNGKLRRPTNRSIVAESRVRAFVMVSSDQSQ